MGFLYLPFVFPQNTPFPDVVIELKNASLAHKKVNSDSLLYVLKSYYYSAQTPDFLKVKAVLELCKLYGLNTNPLKNADSTLKYAYLLINLGKKTNNSLTVFDGLLYKIDAMNDAHNYPKSLEYCVDGLRYADSVGVEGLEYYHARLHLYYALNLRTLGDHDNSIRQNIQAIDFLKKSKNYPTEELIDYQIDLARTLSVSGQNEAAKENLLMALSSAGKIKSRALEMYIYNELASIFLELNQPEKAEQYVRASRQFFENSNDYFSLCEAYFLTSKIFHQAKNYDKCIEFALKSLNVPANALALRIIINANELLYLSYKAKNQSDRALVYYEKYIESKERSFNKANALEMSFLRKTIEDAELNAKIEQEENLNKEQKKLRNYMIISISILLIMVAVLWYYYRLLHIKNTIVEKQKNEIEVLNSGLEEKVNERTIALQQAYDAIKEAMQKGQTLERKRMAADLHDNIGSLLTAINISLDNINTENLSEREKKIYAGILDMTENAYAEVRILSHNLLPEELEKEGLKMALERLIKKLNNSQKIHFSLIAEELNRHRKNIELNIYAICLELTQNIIKHSYATEAHVSIFEKGRILWLKVSDNGKGLKKNIERGMGLKNIQSRLEDIGGEFFIDSNNKGTEFIISVPLDMVYES
ncbi:tetratricopeptide repeat-containing sensor histidine kinase [Emticicia agri]|uniref:tetratricopeptide repeat-containing sensor histidine kinase n=1 Tax=Emticicia agri TaxID=2492393 RepID=UPI001A92092D|nr:histidine kinase [Emticicia agri]